MRCHWSWLICAVLYAAMAARSGHCQTPAAPLPEGVKAVWDIDKADRQTTPTRERVSINGLWRWQPAAGQAQEVPAGNWGYFKVPGCWPGISDYMQKDTQTVHSHPAWRGERLGGVTAAWYQREIDVPRKWTGRRIVLRVDYLNSAATVYVDGKKAGELQFPAGELDLTGACTPGVKHVLSMLVVAKPFREVMLSFGDTNASRTTRGSVARRGLCGDVCLVGEPAGARIDEVKVSTSVRKGEITVSAAIKELPVESKFTVRAVITDQGRKVKEFTSRTFGAADLAESRIAVTEPWKAEKLWDLHTPENTYEVSVALVGQGGEILDAAHPVRFGFREFWIDGRDFFLNGTRIFLSALPLDNAQVSAAAASYAGARESLRRLKEIGINFVYTHNYGCEPGTHLGFDEILRAADDEGVLVALSQPHFGQYEWRAPDAAEKNGYAHHARFYVRVAGNHPSVVFYSMSHNSTGYDEDMNPDLIDGIQSARSQWAEGNVRGALAAEAIVAKLDPGRIVYHHSSGNLSSMHTMNFYTNMAPAQELDDWFEHWATKGVKPVFTCEYMVPCTWDWTMYRGWYKGSREFGSAQVPWEFCVAEWSAQFLGDSVYQIGDAEKRNIRWEADQFRQGKLWHRWDYPFQVGANVFDSQHEIIGAYLTSNWRAFRTWGVSAISPWEHHFFWTLRDGVDKSRQELAVDWENLQRPGFSPDYLDERYERMDLAFEPSDWIATADGQAILRNNRPLLAYIGGEPEAFTSKDHIFYAGETVKKQLIVINNSRRAVTADCQWLIGLPTQQGGTAKIEVPTGEQSRIPIHFTLPPNLTPSECELYAEVNFSGGVTQKDSFRIRTMRRPDALSPDAKIALFDPKGETTEILRSMRVDARRVEANANLANDEILIVGKGALTADGPGPDIGRVRDGLKVIVFEQTAEALEQRLGFRVAQYGLRQVFKRVPDHPLLAGIDQEHLRDWRGSATILPPRLEYSKSQSFGGPAVQWCGIEVPRVWRCGNQGNVASVLIEKPARGDFLPILDGGYSLQYSPLIEYREGQGMVLFCQLDVTGRTKADPAAEMLARNVVRYVAGWKPDARQEAVYMGDPTARAYLKFAGIPLHDYEGGKIPPEQVLIIAAGDAKLSKNAAAVEQFLNARGQVLALGLDEQQAKAYLPLKIGMRKGEHIAAWFEAPAARSAFRGIAPADVHNRDPRELPLVADGAEVLGNGVLARARDKDVVFFQFPPYAVTGARGEVPSFSIDGDDALEGKQSALVTLGMTAGAGVQFGQPMKTPPEVGKTYTFAVFLKSVGGPVRARLEVERAGSPWDRAARGEEVLVPDDQWTEVHVTFPCEKPFPEGWQAYVACAQDGGQFRADFFRLYEGEYVAADPKSEAAGPKNLLANAGFESGRKPWFFSFHEQLNKRRTYRRTAFALSRLLANMGIAAPAPLLARFSAPVGGDQPAPGPSVVRNGDFRQAADERAMPDHWQFTSSSREDRCTRERLEGSEGWTLAMQMSGDGDRRTSVMLAQQDVPVKESQWYRITLKARAEGMAGKTVTLAIQDTKAWTSLIAYQTFAPVDEWRTFEFLAPASGTAEKNTRLQIWHGNAGTLWLSDISMVPVAPPARDGRWLKGLYLDQPEDWDDPYRFFRW